MKFVASIALLLLLVAVAAGSDLESLLKELESIRSEVSQLATQTRNAKTLDSAMLGRLDALKARINAPKFGRAEVNGVEIDIDKRWIIRYLEESETNQSKAHAIFVEIDERIGAIELRLGELMDAESAGRTKDADKQKIDEILRRPEFIPPKKEKSLIDEILEKIFKWLNERLPEQEAPKDAPEGLKTISVVIQVLLYTIVIALLAFILFKFAPFLADKLRRLEREDRGERVILGEKIASDEDSSTLFGEAEALAQSGDLRGAIRKGYVALLCELSDRKIIGLAHHKTNRDYLRDVRRNRDLHHDMSLLTNNFERHWYGFETVEKKDWEEFRSGYERTLKA